MDQNLCHYVGVMKLQLITTGAIMAFSFTANLNAQDKTDPYYKGDKSGIAKPVPTKSSGVAAGDKENISETYTVMYEMFSLPLSEASTLMRSEKSDEKIYLYLIQKAKQEWLAVARTRSGERSTIESINEFIYPTEFDAPSLPTTLGVQIVPVDEKEDEKKDTPQLQKLTQAPRLKDMEGVAVPALPAAFATRNAGVTIEFEAYIVGEICNIRISPEYVALTGTTTHGQGMSKTSMPEFEKQGLTTAVNCLLNKPALLGTMNRSPFSKLGLPDKVWFAMITVKPVRY